VTLWRLLPWAPDARATDPGGALWFPRELQGHGRHDNPARYGCLYVAEHPVSAVAEALAPFRGTGRLAATMLLRGGSELALAELRLGDRAELVDLDSPRVLADVRLRPSEVATNMRVVTQAQAERIFDERPDVLGLRWWSTLEASLINVTLYDRAAARLRFTHAVPLTLSHPSVVEAAELLGLTPARR
jgi:RES domain